MPPTTVFNSSSSSRTSFAPRPCTVPYPTSPSSVSTSTTIELAAAMALVAVQCGVPSGIDTAWPLMRVIFMRVPRSG